jgi:hypothetical protein
VRRRQYCRPTSLLGLFVAPVLLDAAYDASLRDLRDNWAPLLGLVVVAVGLTTAAVAAEAHALVPGMPWAAAIAVGAIVAPPDAVAATAILRSLKPPQRILRAQTAAGSDSACSEPVPEEGNPCTAPALAPPNAATRTTVAGTDSASPGLAAVPLLHWVRASET